MRIFRPTLVLVFVIGLFASSTMPPRLAAQAFDESFAIWPVDLKIGGTIIAGGKNVPSDESARIFLNAAGPNPSVVLIRLGDPSASSWAELKKQFETLDAFEIVEVPEEQSKISLEEVETIKNSNAIWISSADKLSNDQTTLLDQWLAMASLIVDEGGVLCLSGVAVEALGQFQRDEHDDQVTTRNASNLIPNTLIMTGYHDTHHRSAMLSGLAAHPRCVGIGIEDNAAIVLSGRKIRVIGDGQATFRLMANEHQPLRLQIVGKRQSRRSSPYETTVDLTAWRRDAIERTVEPFPSVSPPIPVVENGTLVIVGGGGMPRGLMARFVELAGGENARIVFVPCTETETLSRDPSMIAIWKKLGVASAVVLHTKDRNQANSDEAFLAPLKDATGIWFGGGRQWNLADSYYGTRAHQMMKQVLARGGVVGGSSAGASIQASYLCRANPVANFDIMAPGYERGLGFIGGIAIDQHFSQRGRQKDMTQLVNRYPQLLGIGIDESTALIVKKSNAEIVGRGKVHFYDRTQPVVPGSDDFLALEAGDWFDLAQRKVVENPDEASQDE